MENGKVQKTYKVSSSGEPSPIEKVFTSISLSLLFTYSSSLSWRIVFLLLLAIQLLVIVTCLYSMVRPLVSKLTRPCLSWYPWHVIGGTLVSLPLLAALSHVELASSSNESLHVYSCSVFVGLVHFCNFTQLNCWMKSSLATLGGLMYLLLTTSAVVANPQLWSVDNATFDEAIYNLTKASFGLSYAVKFLYDYPSESDYPSKPPLYPMDTEHPNFALSDAQIETLRRSYFFLAEIFLSVLLLVLLVWFLNREFEKSYRLSFHSNAVAAKDKAKVEEMKVQAEKLLYNIIPKHVAEHLKSNTRYALCEIKLSNIAE
ncbi:unnamed protein product [Nesidiocoris tenuis]|uniref:Adenylate cyclase N-terminal domain-containing protein n=1 Tax=Nesidiocoris tenuis TaxID=355587 RepID=A0A6H5FX01_9HEMI|nr:unnamed protein product [Nesidiocoris tenuis]CAA9994130.1 unnamed protein product [Nesidiocoris tenuis]